MWREQLVGDEEWFMQYRGTGKVIYRISALLGRV